VAFTLVLDRDYAKLLHEDLALRQNLKKRFSHAGVSRIETERAANKLKIDIYTSRPGIIIGRKGTEVDKLKQEIQKRTSRRSSSTSRKSRSRARGAADL
jgi:small subunit ribosomal protein S3